MVSQRDSDRNADFDCVPASLAACLQFLTGKHYTASAIKDAVYGTPYTGGTAAIKYVDYARGQGVLLYPLNGNGGQLVATMKSMIASGHPCLLTEPDPYMPAGSGYTHVCAAYAFDSASITVMDPWIDQPVKKSDGTWASQLQDNQIWILEKIDMFIPTGWKDDGTTLTAPNGHSCRTGFRGKVLEGWEASDMPVEQEHGTDTPGHTQQTFSRTLLEWTSAEGVTVHSLPATTADEQVQALQDKLKQIATIATT